MSFFKTQYFLILSFLAYSKSLRATLHTETKPEIKIVQWLELGESRLDEPSRSGFHPDDTDFIAVDQNEHTMSISNNIAVVILNCRADYPIEWTSTSSENIFNAGRHHYLRGLSTREVGNLFTDRIYRYAIDFIFGGNFKEFTGNYTCRKVGDDRVSDYYYMFWEGVEPVDLVQSRQSINIPLLPSTKKLVLPCIVSVKDTNVTLVKSMIDMYYIDNFHEILPNKYISYDPKIGYTIDLDGKMDPTGVYLCATQKPYDFLKVTVKKDISDNRHHVDRIQRNANFTYDKDRQKIVCCAAERSQPLIAGMECLEPQMCQLFEMAFSKALVRLYQGALGQTRLIQQNRTCISMEFHIQMATHAQCKGEGVDVLRTIYMTIPSSGNNYTRKAYMSWDAVDPKQLITITVNEEFSENDWDRLKRLRGPRHEKLKWKTGYRSPGSIGNAANDTLPEKVYVGESFNFTCRASPNYFAHGSQFALRYNRSTPHLRHLDAIAPRSHRYDLYYLENPSTEVTVNVALTKDMVGLVCYAPVFNTSEWIQKELKFNVLEPVFPTFLPNPSDETVYFALNDTLKTIVCDAKGDPLPAVTIFFNDQEIVNGSEKFSLDRKNHSLVITIQRVSQETKGDYYCAATNLAGVAYKKIVVMVVEPTHWASTVGVIIVISVLATGLVLAAVKLKIPHLLREKLARNVYARYRG